MTVATAVRSSTATLSDIDHAIAAGDWQAAYDASMSVTLDRGALDRLLRVADELHTRGASEAALDVLDRGIEPYKGTPRLYAHLARVLLSLQRNEDARLARQLVEVTSFSNDRNN